MGNSMEEFKKNVLSVIKKVMKPLIVIFLIIILFVSIVASLIYDLNIEEGSYNDGDKTNAPYVVASQYTRNVIINSDGTINSSMTAQALWDQMKENNNDIIKYLDKPEELLKLMNAELVTQYPDTRSASEIDTAIKWDSINDINSTKVQGIVKLKRAQEDGTTSNLTYVDSDTFYNWMEEYSQTGDETVKQNILTRFTIEQNITSNSTSEVELDYNTNDIVTDISQRIVAAAKITPSPGEGMCQSWVRQVYAKAGLPDVPYGTATIAYNATRKSTEMNNIPIGATVYGTGSPSYGDSGHVGIYIGNGLVMDNVGTIKTSTLEEWIAWQEESGCVIDDKTGWLGWGWQSGEPSQIISGSDSETDDSSDKTVELSEMELLTENGEITFYNNDDDTTEGGELNALGDKLTDGQVAVDPTYIPYRSVIYVETENSGEGSYANGKFFYTSDTGTGITGWQVDVFADVEKNALEMAPFGKYNSSKGAKIYLVESDVELADYQTRYLNMTSTTDSRPSYNVVVANWSQIEEKITTTDPDIETKDVPHYSINTQKINFQDFISGYTMPFNYLWALLVIGEEKDFVLELADLVYGSEIEITIHDNLMTNTNVKTDKYTKKTKVETNTTVNVEYANGLESAIEIGGPFEDEIQKEYEIVYTTITKTNRLDIALTKANVWIANHEQSFTYEVPDKIGPTSNDPEPLDGVPYPNEYPTEPNKEEKDDGLGLAENFEKEILAKYEADYPNTDVKASIWNVYSKYYYSQTNATEVITNTLESNKYVSSPAKVEGKIDKEASEPNFVTIFLKQENVEAKKNILSVPDWLFEILGNNSDTVDMIDLTKYLLYKATSIDLGVTEFDFSDYEKRNFSNVSGLYGGSFEEKVWFALLDAGYSKEAIAGAMGNFSQESGFISYIIGGDKKPYEASKDYTAKVNDGTYTKEEFTKDRKGYGLAQWTFSSRKAGLYSFAQDRGVGIDDEQMQIEFLIQELKSGAYINWETAETVEEACKIFFEEYENPGDSTLPTRMQNAVEYYDKFKDQEKPSSVTSKGVRCPRYYQGGGQPWSNNYYNSGGTIATDGCGACALAMAVSGLTQTSVTPDIIVEYLNSIGKNTVYNGAGSAQSVAAKYGLTYSQISRTDKASIDKSLDEGKCLIFSINANGIYTNASVGHYIMCYGRDASGYYVIESGNNYYETDRPYSFNQVFTGGNQGVFALGK